MNKTTFIVWALAAVFISGVASGIYMCQGEPPEMYQAAMHISNWTNRTLDIDIWVLGGSQYDHVNLTLNHGENVTIIITFGGVKESITFIHYTGKDINQVIPYVIGAGEWQSVVLI